METNTKILKVNDTVKFNIVMRISIDFETEEIGLHISHWDKVKGTVCGYDYPASEFSAAIAKFNELESLYENIDTREIEW